MLLVPVVLLGIPSCIAIAQNPSLQSPEPRAWLGGGDLSCWLLAGGLQLYRTRLSSEQLTEGRLCWVWRMLRLVKVLLGRK